MFFKKKGNYKTFNIKMARVRTVFVQTIETNSLLYDYSETPSLSSGEEAFLLRHHEIL